MKYIKLLIFTSIVFALFTPSANAQSVVSGVVSAEDGETLPGVNIMVQGTNTGTSTSIDGSYEIEVPDDNSTLVFSYIGFVTREVAVEGREEINIQLTAEAAQLDELVVTSFGIERERRSLGYSIQDIDGEDFSEARESNVLNSLSGRVAGVNIINSGSGLAGSPNIVIRGETSLSGNNKPLFVVDGVPIDNSSTTAVANAQTSQADFGDALSQINPDDVEEISILKGPNAAALYGSRAANGVVLITTKSGEGTSGLGVSYNSNVTFESILKLPDYQDEYGAGSGGEYWFVNGDGTDGGIDGQGYNWGPPLDGRLIPQFGSPRDSDGNLEPIPFEPRPGNVRDFFNTGNSVSHNLSIYGGNEEGHFRLSVSDMSQAGIVPNSDLQRTNLSLNAGYNLSDRFTVDGVINYAKTGSDNIPNSGYGSESLMYTFIWWGRHLEADWLRDYWQEGMEGVQQNNYDNNWTNNIYFQAYENTNSMDKDRLFGNISTNLDITDNLSLMTRAGMDYNDQVTHMRKAFSSVTAPYGNYREDDSRFHEYNFDFLLSYNNQLSEDWGLSASAGSNYMYQDRRYLMTEAPELSIPGIYNFGNSRVNLSTEHFTEEKSIASVYGLTELSFRDIVFLDLTARNDWSSTLPSGENSYFYPSVSTSIILTDLLDIPSTSPLSFAKLRAGWAQVGNDTDPYRLSNTYSYLQAWGSTQSVSDASTIANAELKPEITSSYETGADIRFFEGRLGFDATYYFGSTRNQILSVPLPVSSGYQGRYLNAGEIQNQGWEVVLSGTPVQVTNGLIWDVTFNWDRNRSKVIELADGIDSYLIGNPYGGSVEARIDGRMGDMYGLVFQRDPDGNIIHQNGLPLMTEDVERIGNYNNDWHAGISNRFRYKQFSFDFLFDYRHGGRLYSYTHATGIEGGTTVETAVREGETVGEGVMIANDGSYVKNDVAVEYVTYTRNYYDRNNIESNSFDASYLKLREVKLGYTLPARLAEQLHISSATFSLVGRNLMLWSEVPHVDPETAYMSGSQHVPGFEVHQLPSTKSFGFNINLEI
ncbi:MAG: SusC/RagA family TonB-linked outer membrane protein [Balneolales bacterium]